MPMSGSCRRSDGGPVGPAPGFTLLELLIVLALVAMVAALAAPRLQQTYDAVSRSGERAEVARQLARLPIIARTRGEAIFIDGDAGPGAVGLDAFLDLPDGWTVQAVGALHVEASGVCHPAQVEVASAGMTETWDLAAPACGVANGP